MNRKNPISGEEDNRQSPFHPSPAQMHLAFQNLFIYLVAPGCIASLGALSFFFYCWQFLAVFIAFIATTLLWLIGNYQLTRAGRVETSIALFVSGAVCFLTVTAVMIQGILPIIMMSFCGTIAYAAFHSVRFLFAIAVLVAMVYIAAVLAPELAPFPMRILSPTEQVVTGIPIAMILIGIIVAMLMRSRKLTDNLLQLAQNADHIRAEVTKIALHSSRVIEETTTQLKRAIESCSGKIAEHVALTRNASSSIVILDGSATETASMLSRSHPGAQAFGKKSVLGREHTEKIQSHTQKIVSHNRKTEDVFAKLTVDAAKIEEILRSNNDVVGQIKILAINTAIQASKAGKHGKGFGIVARELKSMIHKTEESLTQSHQILVEIQSETRRSSETITASTSVLSSLIASVDFSRSINAEISGICIATIEQLESAAELARTNKERLHALAIDVRNLEQISTKLIGSTNAMKKTVDQLAESNDALRVGLKAFPNSPTDQRE